MHAKFVLRTAALCLGLFIAMLICLEIGRRLGIQQAALHGDAARAGIGVVDGAVYAVLALLLGFTFNGATNRFDHRRQLITKQVASTNNAWLRIDSLPGDAQPAIRDTFRRYIDVIIETHARAPHPDSPDGRRQRSAMREAERGLWNSAVAVCTSDRGEKARMLLLPSVNEMFMAVEHEDLARRIHTPAAIWVMLAAAALMASVFAGYSMANSSTHNWLYHFGIAATISIVAFVIVQIEYPRLGFVRVDAMDQALVEARTAMQSPGEDRSEQRRRLAI
jgi:hypothetical protein